MGMGSQQLSDETKFFFLRNSSVVILNFALNLRKEHTGLRFIVTFEKIRRRLLHRKKPRDSTSLHSTYFGHIGLEPRLYLH